MSQTVQINVASLKDRVTKILTTPRTEWPVIAAEATDVQKLYREYIAILAAIPAVAGFIGTSIVGVTVPFVGTIRYPIVSGFASMIVSYVLSLAGVYLAAVVIEKLAPKFDSTPNTMQALKLVAYSCTPAYVAGVLYIIPALSVLVIVAALYGVFLFYLGLPVLMKTPESKVVPYMAVSAVVVIAIGIVVAVLSAAVTGVSGGTRL